MRSVTYSVHDYGAEGLKVAVTFEDKKPSKAEKVTIKFIHELVEKSLAVVFGSPDATMEGSGEVPGFVDEHIRKIRGKS